MSVSYSGGNPITRKYTYDRMNRLTAMASSDGFNTAYTYNLNSSPLTIQRYGITSDGTVGLIDDLTLKYSGNQLTRVDDAADPVILENSLDFDKSSRNYTYDLDGRLYSDGNIYSTKYTPQGNPLALKGNYSYVFATYRYTATGIKLSATTAMTTSYNQAKPTRYYLGMMEFHRATTDKAPRLERVAMPWGYLDAAGAVHYYVQDYQGNIRVVADASGNIEQATDYYPYGMPMATSTGAEVNRYKYSGKELETRNGLNFYDFAARLHFSDRNLFNQPDPYADYNWLNPYLYCAANPIANIDPTGQDIWRVNQMGEVVDKEEDPDNDIIIIVKVNNQPNNNSTSNNEASSSDKPTYTEIDRMTFKSGTIIKHRKISFKSYERMEVKMPGGEADMFEVRGDENATKLFEFMAKNISGASMNEVSLAKTGIEGDKGHNFITSGQRLGSDPGMTALLNSQLKFGYNIRELTHAHPLSTTVAQNDLTFKQGVTKISLLQNNRIPVFKIYHVPTGQYIKY